MVKIKPCPFCGSTDVEIQAGRSDISKDFELFNVECLSCNGKGGERNDITRAIECWNRRYDDE